MCVFVRDEIYRTRAQATAHPELFIEKFSCTAVYASDVCVCLSLCECAHAYRNVSAIGLKNFDVSGVR